MVSKRTCPECKKEFISPDNLYKGVVRPKVFCSYKCYRKLYQRKRNQKPPPESKVCSQCGREFIPQKNHPNQSFCNKECYKQSDQYKAVRENYKPKVREAFRSGKYNESKKKYYNSEKGKAAWKRYSQSEKGEAARKKSNQSEKSKLNRKLYKIKNADKEKAYAKKYWSTYGTKRRKVDPLYKLTQDMRLRILRFLRISKMAKTNTTFNMVGCAPQFLKEYLENKFYSHPKTHEPMTWKNHGIRGWHIDHIIPLDNAKTSEELEKLCHYTNLQPLWFEDNIKKSNKF